MPWLSKLADVDGAHMQEPSDEDLPDLAQRGFASDGGTMTLERFLASINALGPRWVVVTDGKDGAYVGTTSGVTHCPALPVEIVGTAGAGDAFNATFAVFILNGASVDEAATAAAINAASVVTHLDTQTGLLRHEGLAVRIAAQRDGLRLRHWLAEVDTHRR